MMTIQIALTRREIVASFFRSLALSSSYRRRIILLALLPGGMNLLLVGILNRSINLGNLIVAIAITIGFSLFLPIWLFIRGRHLNEL